jgi:hypothetical protein
MFSFTFSGPTARRMSDMFSFTFSGPTARRMRRQADGWQREAEAHSADASDGSIRFLAAG